MAEVCGIAPDEVQQRVVLVLFGIEQRGLLAELYLVGFLVEVGPGGVASSADLDVERLGLRTGRLVTGEPVGVEPVFSGNILLLLVDDAPLFSVDVDYGECAGGVDTLRGGLGIPMCAAYKRLCLRRAGESGSNYPPPLGHNKLICNAL